MWFSCVQLWYDESNVANMADSDAADENEDLGAQLLTYDGLTLPSNDEIEQNAFENRSLQCSTGLSYDSATPVPPPLPPPQNHHHVHHYSSTPPNVLAMPTYAAHAINMPPPPRLPSPMMASGEDAENFTSRDTYRQSPTLPSAYTSYPPHTPMSFLSSLGIYPHTTYKQLFQIFIF